MSATVERQATLEVIGGPKVESQALAPKTATDALVSMLERIAANPDVNVDKLQKLIDLQERILLRDAEAAFNSSFALMQPKIPTISERAKTDKTKYAPLEDIIDPLRPILSEFGFALSHRTEWPDKATVRVVGILTHRDGHARTSEFLSGADQSGSKNAIQALGSAVAYGRRYTTKDLLCIVTRDEDDDGHKTTPRTEDPDGYAEWVAKLETASERGMAILTAGFNDGDIKFRNRLTGTDRNRWSVIKAKAAAVKS